MFGSDYLSQSIPSFPQSLQSSNNLNSQIPDFSHNYTNFTFSPNPQNITQSQDSFQNNIPQQNFSNNLLNIKQFENVFYEKMKIFPLQINEYLINNKENTNIKNLLSSLNDSSLITNDKINKINTTFSEKLTDSNTQVEKFYEICKNIENSLNLINTELLNHFSLLTSFHGYDERIHAEGKKNFENIQKIINECNKILSDEIIDVNNQTINFNNELNINLEQLKLILSPELYKISSFLTELADLKKNKNINYEKYQNITNNVIDIINQLKNKFIFVKEISKKKLTQEKININDNCNDENKENINMNSNNNIGDNISSNNICCNINNINNMNYMTQINEINDPNKKATFNYMKKILRRKKCNRTNMIY